MAPESTQKRPFVSGVALAFRLTASHSRLRAWPLMIGTRDGFFGRLRFALENLTLFCGAGSRVRISSLSFSIPLRFDRFVRSTVVGLYLLPCGTHVASNFVATYVGESGPIPYRFRKFRLSGFEF